MRSGKGKSKSSSAPVVEAPKKLGKYQTLVTGVQTSLSSAPAEGIFGSPDGIRAALKSTFAVAAGLHSDAFQFRARAIDVDKRKNITTEQIWGQLNVLLAPVMTQARRNVDALCSKIDQVVDEKALVDDGEGDEEVEMDEEMDGNDFGSDDEEQLFGDKNKGAKKKKGGDIEKKDAWRYAFGVDGAEEEDEEMSEDGGNGDDEDGDRIRKRNQIAMDDVDEEDEENGEEGEENAEDEKAALKELYGSDFSDEEGARLGDFGDEEDDMADANEYEEGEEAAPFRELDGAYFGQDDILQEKNDYFDDEDQQPDEELDDPTLTTLQRQSIIERRQIDAVEKERLFNAPWAMSGEVGALKRPKDSLLDETLDFEHAMKPVPVITERTTALLEDRIKRRIAESLFDDVVRRIARTSADDLVTTRRDAGVESEKSKLSLMDLYEKEFLNKMKLAEGPEAVASAEPLTEIEKDELRAIQLWKRLAQHLDALSNFHFTPKPIQQDLDARVRAVEHQAPAIAIENVGNLAVSRASALAPQDAYMPSNHVKAGVNVAEMDPKEKRSLRRAKKERFAVGKERKDAKTAAFVTAKDAAKAKAAAAKAQSSKKGSKR
jgi:U3 small nucleolar RNA-associated protein MPP10